MAASTTTWWVVGYAIGAAVVLIAATLLLTIILLARRIARQARDIAWALEEATRHTEALFELAQMNHAVEQLSRALAADGGAEDERGPIRRVVDKLTAGKL